MSKSQAGMSFHETVWELIEAERETDQADPAFQNASEFVEETFLLGLTVRRVWEQTGLWEDTEPHEVRSAAGNLLRQGLAEDDVDVSDVDVRIRPYDFEGE